MSGSCRKDDSCYEGLSLQPVWTGGMITATNNSFNVHIGTEVCQESRQA